MKTTSPSTSRFAEPPFLPMPRQMKAVADCVAKAAPLFEAPRDGDRKKLPSAMNVIFALEDEAVGRGTEKD